MFSYLKFLIFKWQQPKEEKLQGSFLITGFKKTIKKIRKNIRQKENHLLNVRLDRMEKARKIIISNRNFRLNIVRSRPGRAFEAARQYDAANKIKAFFKRVVRYNKALKIIEQVKVLYVLAKEAKQMKAITAKDYNANDLILRPMTKLDHDFTLFQAVCRSFLVQSQLKEQRSNLMKQRLEKKPFLYSQPYYVINEHPSNDQYDISCDLLSHFFKTDIRIVHNLDGQFEQATYNHLKRVNGLWSVPFLAATARWEEIRQQKKMSDEFCYFIGLTYTMSMLPATNEKFDGWTFIRKPMRKTRNIIYTVEFVNNTKQIICQPYHPNQWRGQMLVFVLDFAGNKFSATKIPIERKPVVSLREIQLQEAQRKQWANAKVFIPKSSTTAINQVPTAIIDYGCNDKYCRYCHCILLGWTEKRRNECSDCRIVHGQQRNLMNQRQTNASSSQTRKCTCWKFWRQRGNGPAHAPKCAKVLQIDQQLDDYLNRTTFTIADTIKEFNDLQSLSSYSDSLTEFELFPQSRDYNSDIESDPEDENFFECT